MPRIKAYKGNRAIIPVDDARLSTAYKCPWTQKLFSTKRPYVNHLKELRNSRMHARARKARHQRLCNEFNNQPTFEKVIEWARNHPEFFFDNAIRWDPFQNKDPKAYALKRANFEFEIIQLKLRWDPRVSNTHSCPRGGVQNWGCLDGRPKSYPGWQGRIVFKAGEVPGFGSALLENTGINTGGGGGGGDTRSYEVKFFDADWPEITRRREKFDTVHSLGGPALEWFEYSKGTVQQ